MPSPKSGSAGSAVSPAAPQSAELADEANPGEVEKVKAEQRKTNSGKYGSVAIKPFKPPTDEEAKKTKKAWIEIKMVDESDAPIPGMPFRITLPDDTVAEGTLDEKGCARLEGIEPGTCKITFPDLDQEAWEDA
jgi:type VI secretion system secreted protein VgrG